MTVSDIVSIPALIASIGALFFAFKAYIESRELSFPAKNAHSMTCRIMELSKESKDLCRFIEKNIDKRVYINAWFDSSGVEYNESETPNIYNVTATLTIWIDNFEPVKDGENLSTFNSTSLLIQISGEHKHHLSWHKGGYQLQGYFAVEAFGMQQGQYGSMLRPLKIT